jgi:hypothetical protein
MAALVCSCYRRRQRRVRRRGSWLPEISPPLPQNPFADPMGKPTMREHVGSNVPPDRFIFPRNQPHTTQSSSNVPLTRSQDGVPVTHGVVDIPTQLPPATRVRSKSSYRVPVPYASLDVLDNNSRIAGQQQYPDPSRGQIGLLPDIPPVPPMRSPLRLLAAKSDSKKTAEDDRGLSRSSSPSVYPPSLRHSDGEVDSLYQREVVAASPSSGRDNSGWLSGGPASDNEPSKAPKREQVSRPSPGTHLSSVDSDGAHHSFLQTVPLSLQARYPPLRIPASELGRAQFYSG